MARLLGSVLAVIALLMVTAACGGGGGAAPTPTPPATATVAPLATQPPPTPVALPDTGPATEIGLPPGFTAYAIAEGLFRPTSIAIAPDGTVFVSERHGRLFRLADEDGDGVFEELVLWSQTEGDITGILAASDGSVYVSRTGEVFLVIDTDGDGAGDSSREIISGLPHGLHQNNGMVFGPDGKLYLTNGATCDDCVESDERSATILQANADGTGLRVYARGLRNPYDLAFDANGRLWATDNGSDAPCATVDELNVIVDGGDYGWPYGADGCDPFTDGIAPVASLGLHTASTGIVYYDGFQFPDHIYAGSLFLTLWGSVVFPPELPPALMRAVPDAGGANASIEAFGTGFSHPIDVAVDRDGTLLVLDYGLGRLYRVVYAGG